MKELEGRCENVGMSVSSNGSTRNCFDRDDQWIGVRLDDQWIGVRFEET